MATKYLTAGHSNSPYITTYSQSGSSFTKLSNPSTLPVDNVYAVHWNYNATSLAVATLVTSPYVIVYNVASDVFTKIAEFTELSGSLAVAWSPDGSKLVLGDIDSPYIRIYNRSGDTFNQISDPGTLPTGAAQGLSWSPDGNKLAVAHSSSPFVTVYQVSGDTFTKVTNPGTLPHGEGYAVAWNPTSDVLAVGGQGTSSIYPGRVYNYSSNTLSYVSDIGLPGTGVLIQRDGLAWRPNGNQLAMMSNQANVIYNKSGDTYTSSGANITLAGTAGPVEWDNFGNTIAIGHTSSPYISIYNQVSDSGFVKFANPGTLPTSQVRSLAWTFATATQSGNLSVSSAFTTTGLANRSSSAGVVVLSSVSVTALLGYLKTATANISTVTSTVLSADVLAEGYADAYFDSDYVAAGYVVRPRLGQAVLTSTSTVSASVSFIKTANVSLLAFNTVLSAGSRLASGVDIVLGSFSLAATAYEFTKATVSLTSAVTSTTLGVKVFGSQVSITSTASMAVSASVIRSATVALSAFNTVVSAGGRIRPAVDLTASQAILTASASMIRHGISIYQAPEAPTGIVVDTTHITSLTGFFPEIGGDFTNNAVTLESPLASTDIAFWIKITSAQVIWSTTLIDTYATDFWTGYVFRYTGSGFSLVSNYYAGYTSPNNLLSTTTLTWGGSLGAGWNHIYLHITESTNELYINGQSQGAGSGVSPGAINLAQPIILGAEQRITGNPGSSSRNYDYINTSSNFQMAQFWAGRAQVSPVATPGAFYNTTSMSGSLGYYNLGADGHDGFNTTFDKVYFYNELNYPYVNGRLSPGDARSTQRGVSTFFPYVTTDQSFIPGWLARTATTFADEIIPYYPARFRLFSQGGLLKHGQLTASSAFALTTTPYNFTKAQAAIISTAALTARINYSKLAVGNLTSSISLLATLTKLQTSTVNLTSASTFAAVSYEFTKAGATISSGAFTLSANPDEISGGISLSLGSFSLTSAGRVIRDSRTSVAGVLTLTANGDVKIQGLVALFTAFTVSATPRVVYPIRPEAMTMSAAFSLSPTTLRFRSSQIPITSAFIFNGITGAIRAGSSSMSAFDTVLSAGKIIEFLLENTIVVTEEQRRLRVALESTVLLVQMANGVNTITAETTDIVVPQEQGRLLAQYNQPTN